MKKLNVFLAILLVAVFAVFALGSGEESVTEQGTDSVQRQETVENGIGDYSVSIESCRLAKDYSGKDVVIVKYIFTNVADEDAASFSWAFDDAVYQAGVGLNKAYMLDDSANYNADNKTKEIKMGATLEVEVAYELNDTTTDIEVEVMELFSFDDSKITKTFKIAE